MSPHELLRDATRTIGQYVRPNTPAKFLELGCGWGLYGMILRNFFDAWFGRFRKEDFLVTVDGIDASDIEISEITYQFYDKIWVADALSKLRDMDSNSYDVVFGIEVIEHLTKPCGQELLDEALRVASKGVVFSTPHPDCWEDQPEWHGNPFMAHKSVWSTDEFRDLGFSIMDTRPSFIAHRRPPYGTIGVGVVTFNRLDLLRKCLPSWQSVPEGHLAIFDNGSDSDVIEYLGQQDTRKVFLSDKNRGTAYARNKLIRYFKGLGGIKYILLPDSDIQLHEGAVGEMCEVLENDGDVGIVGYPQANAGFDVYDGYVEEIAHECAMTRVELWDDLQYPESLIYYSSDSYLSTLANMLGWRTKLVEGKGDGYTHFKHGSHKNEGVTQQASKDVRRWSEMEAKMVAYWLHRGEHGKGKYSITKD